MISYFKFKNTNTGTQIFLRKKRNVFDKPKETYISKKGNILITGILASGKSKKLESFNKKADELWKDKVISFSATDSISEIFHKNLNGHSEITDLLSVTEKLDTSKNFVKAMALVEKAKNSTIIIDDIDRLSGKKLEITKDLIRTKI